MFHPLSAGLAVRLLMVRYGLIAEKIAVNCFIMIIRTRFQLLFLFAVMAAFIFSLRRARRSFCIAGKRRGICSSCADIVMNLLMIPVHIFFNIPDHIFRRSVSIIRIKSTGFQHNPG